MWLAALADTGVTPKRTRPYRTQTNGKVERFHRVLLEEWASALRASELVALNAAYLTFIGGRRIAQSQSEAGIAGCAGRSW